jgi:excisionase family DNA binding protein
MTVWAETLVIGLTGSPGKIRHVEVNGTTEHGGHSSDKFLEGAHELPDEIAELTGPAELTRLMAAVINADTEPPAPGRPQEQPAAGRAGTASSPEELISPAQAAAILNVSTATLYRWDREGILTSVRTKGNHRRFRTPEVRALRPLLIPEGTISHREAASMAGVEVKTIERWARTGKLTPITSPLLPKRRRYRETEVKALTETQNTRPADAPGNPGNRKNAE